MTDKLRETLEKLTLGLGFTGTDKAYMLGACDMHSAAQRILTADQAPTPAQDYAPCPTCRQYSHSIGTDALSAAFNHFHTLIAHPVRGHPMGEAFDAATRDAAQVLMAAARDRMPGREELEYQLQEAFDRGAYWQRHGYVSYDEAMKSALSDCSAALLTAQPDSGDGWLPIDSAPQGDEDAGPFIDLLWAGQAHRYLPVPVRQIDCVRQGEVFKREHGYPSVTTIFGSRPSHWRPSPRLAATPSQPDEVQPPTEGGV